MKYLSRSVIVDLNFRLIDRTRGTYVPPENLINPHTLEWVLQAMEYPLFGRDQYPSLIDKACILGFSIIEGHVFYDGNKRTGMAATELFLRINGFRLLESDQGIINMALHLTAPISSDIKKRNFIEWLMTRISYD